MHRALYKRQLPSPLIGAHVTIFCLSIKDVPGYLFDRSTHAVAIDCLVEKFGVYIKLGWLR